MKKFLLASLVLASTTLMAQDRTISVTANVGGCITQRLMGADASDGNEWELRLIPLNKDGSEQKNKIQTVEVESDICRSRPDAYHQITEYIDGNPYKGPDLQASIQLAPNQLFKVQIREKDWGLHYILGGGHEEYELGIFTPNMVKPGAPLVKGKALVVDSTDCLKLENF